MPALCTLLYLELLYTWPLWQIVEQNADIHTLQSANAERVRLKLNAERTPLHSALGHHKVRKFTM